MAELRGLPGVTEAELDRFRVAEIRSIDQLWAEVGGDPAEGVQRVARVTGIAQERLVHLLKMRALAEVPPGYSWWRQHLADLAAVVSVVCGVLLIARAFGALAALPPPVGHPPWAVVVRDAADLPPFSEIRAEDIVLRRGVWEPGVLGDAADAVGRVTLGLLRKGTAVRAADVGPPGVGETDLAGRRVLTLPVKQSNLPPSVRPGDRVLVVLTAREQAQRAPAGALLSDSIVLSVARRGDGAALVAAVPAAEMPGAAALLGGADVLVVQLPGPDTRRN
jgi:hypothetical protein